MTTTTQALTVDLPDPGPGLPSYAFFALSCVAGASAGVLFGDGIRSPAIGLCALAVCFAGAMAGPGRALVLGGFAALVMVTLVLAELHGGLAIQVAASPWPQALALQAVVLACGVAGGGLLFGMLTQHRRAAAGRERRFQGLLQLAGDGYWEMDPSFRFRSAACWHAAAMPRASCAPTASAVNRPTTRKARSAATGAWCATSATRCTSSSP